MGSMWIAVLLTCNTYFASIRGDGSSSKSNMEGIQDSVLNTLTTRVENLEADLRREQDAMRVLQEELKRLKTMGTAKTSESLVPEKLLMSENILQHVANLVTSQMKSQMDISSGETTGNIHITKEFFNRYMDDFSSQMQEFSRTIRQLGEEQVAISERVTQLSDRVDRIDRLLGDHLSESQTVDVNGTFIKPNNTQAESTTSVNEMKSNGRQASRYSSMPEPPGPPEISGYTYGQVLRAGETLTLTCVSKGGNPPAQVIWFKNEKEIDFSYTVGNTNTVNELTFEVQPSDNAAVYKCEAKNAITTLKSLTASFKLTVFFPPAKVTVTGRKLAKAGEEITLSCVTANSNPAAVVKWFAKGKELKPPQTTSRVQPSDDGGYVTHSDATVRVTAKDDGVVYSCQTANGDQGLVVSDYFPVRVVYPPDPPFISDKTADTPGQPGRLKRLSCTANGGNPNPTLKWFRGDVPLKSNVKKSGTTVTADLTMVLKPEDNEAMYRCQASNAATDVPLQTTITLQVYFPSKGINITTSPPEGKIGQKMTLTCVSAPSNPAAVLSWRTDRYRIRAVDNRVTHTTLGGKVTTSRLEIIPTSEDHGRVYFCRAENVIFGSLIQEAATLNVLFKPEMDADMSGTIISIMEGESKTVNYNVKANPAEVTYYLQRNGVRLNLETDLPRFSIVEGVLTITDVEKMDSGVYTLEAENSEGSTRLTIMVNVL